MEMKLRNYQVKHTNKVTNFLKDNVGRTDLPSREFLFVGPTACGKTVIASAIMESMPNCAYIFLSPSHGGLAVQSANSIENYSNLTVHRATTDLVTRVKYLHAGSVLVMGWQSGNKDSNILIRDSENGNIFDIIRSTVDSGIEIVVLKDEAHFAKNDSSKAKAFEDRLAREIGYSPITIELTATPDEKNIPSPEAISEGTSGYTKIPEADVIAEGMITKSVRINWGWNDNSSEENVEDLAMRSAFETREKIDAGVDWTPAILAQLPNNTMGDKAGDRTKKYVLDFASREWGWTVEGGEVSVLLNDEHASRKLNPNVKLIIFKQSITMGWDYPPATVMVTFRESKQKAINKQTAGRLRRMPEHKHYGDDFLNSSYIFTTLDKSSDLWAKVNAEYEVGVLQDSMLKYVGPEFSLPGVLLNKNKTVNVNRSLIKKSLSESLVAYDDQINSMIAGAKLERTFVADAESVADSDTFQNNTEDVSRELSTNQITQMARKKMQGIARDVDPDILTSALIGWMKDRSDSVSDFGVKSLTVFLQNEQLQSDFSLCINKVLEGFDTEFTLEDYVWTPSSYVSASSQSSEPTDKRCAYQDVDGYPCATFDSKEERMLVQSFDDLGVDWWIKNGTDEGSFQIALSESRHFPDFITEIKGNAAILEVKSEEGAMSVESREKAQYWGNYTSLNGVFAALVYRDGKTKVWMAATTEDVKLDVPLDTLVNHYDLSI
jgi:hypothetical protein